MTETENISPSSSMTSSKSYGSSTSSGGYISSMQEYNNSLQGLPKQFVKSMRTLFDMLDDSNTGAVPLAEIERRWRDDAVPNLPGVLSALREVAPPKQMLTFDIFVCGLRLALSRARRNEVLPLKSLNKVPHKWNDHGDHQPPCLSYPNVATILPSCDSERLRDDSYKFQSKPVVHHNLLKRRDTTVTTSKSSSRPFRHRRSNSGPIFTAKILPNVKTQTSSSKFLTRDDIRIQKIEQNDRIARQNATEIRKLRSGKENNYYQNDTVSRTNVQINDSDGSDKNKKSNLDQITASTLFINELDGPSVVNMQPVVLSGKYIGITGTLKRTKSSANIPQNQQYGSLHRSSKNSDNKPIVVSASMNSFSVMGRSAASSKFSRNTHASCSTIGKSQSSEVLDRKRTIESNNATNDRNEVEQINEDQVNNDGHGRRCNSSSPPEIPVVKSARSSSRAEANQIPKLNLHGSMSSTTLNGDSSANNSPKSAEDVAKALFISPSDSGISQGHDRSPPSFTVSSSVASGMRRRANSSSIQQRRNARRHTVTTGIDYNTIKYMKQLEDQKKLLVHGLESIDSAKMWFQNRLHAINKKQDQLNLKINKGNVGRSTSTENICNKEINGKDLYHADNIVETERQMKSLMNTLSQLQQLLNDASNPGVNCDKTEEQKITMNTLREHNQLLTREVSEKSDQVSQLQKEKSALVRQLFQARAELQQSSGSQVNTSIFI